MLIIIIVYKRKKESKKERKVMHSFHGKGFPKGVTHSLELFKNKPLDPSHHTWRRLTILPYASCDSSSTKVPEFLGGYLLLVVCTKLTKTRFKSFPLRFQTLRNKLSPLVVNDFHLEKKKTLNKNPKQNPKIFLTLPMIVPPPNPHKQTLKYMKIRGAQNKNNLE